MDSEELKRRRRERIIVVFLFFFILLFTGVEIYLLRVSSQLPFVNSIFFFGLMNLNVVLIMLLLFLVFRNVVKLILDEKKGRVGSRLRTRLVFAFILFAIIPTVLLFSISAIYIRNSFDKWFSVKIGGTLQRSIEVVRNYYENTERNASHFVRKIAVSMEEPLGTEKSIEKKIDRARLEFGLDAVEYYADPFAQRVLSVHPKHTAHVPDASIETLSHYFSGESDCRVQNVGVGELLRCGAFLGVGRGVILGSYFIPMSLASRLSEITLSYEDYKTNNPLGYPIKSTYFAILSMMTLLILFSATWTGFYVARRLVVPIEELSRGTEEIAKGNLHYRIRSQRGDEMGKLVDSFNQMTEELQQNRQQIEATHQHLKEVNAQVSHRQRYIEVLLESVQSGVISLDERGRISTVNHAAADLLGVEPQALLGKSYEGLIPVEYQSEFQEILTAVYGKARPIRKEMRLKSPAGELVSVLITLSVLRDEESRFPLGVVAVFDDVTEIQKMQRMIAWREVAKRIAHEIKNPLTPIQLSVQRLRRRYLDTIEDDGTFGKATEIILKEVDAIKNLVSEFSAFARLPDICQLPESLNEIVLEAVSLFRSAHESLRFNLSLEESLPLMNLDRSQLKRVLINLFDNSITAMDKRGEIDVETRWDRSDGLVLLTVRDRGCGIAEDLHQRLFEPYVSTKEGGTGLGLAIVQRIISDHGGFIRVTPNVPKGTQVVIELTEALIVKAEDTSRFTKPHRTDRSLS
ncbi:MAG: ATP-binding protein [Bdellovibrionota bacterium]